MRLADRRHRQRGGPAPSCTAFDEHGPGAQPTPRVYTENLVGGLLRLIISASRRTDIPAFFSGWFMDRVREGVVEVANPFRPDQVRTCSLRPEDVEAIVFWSKNPSPLFEYLDELDARGYRYYFQFTLNDYPSLFEPGVPPVEERIGIFKAFSDRLGPGRVVWRYDPIVVSSLTPAAYHVERFERLARSLSGYSERVVVSFVDFYGKVAARFRRTSEREGIRFEDLTEPSRREELLRFAKQMACIGAGFGFTVTSCAEPVDLTGAGISPGACIDAGLVERLWGGAGGHAGGSVWDGLSARPPGEKGRAGEPARVELSGQLFREDALATGLPQPGSSDSLVGKANACREVLAKKDKGQRKECLCVQSVDIGRYNTCLHGCVYCYASHTGRAECRQQELLTATDNADH